MRSYPLQSATTAASWIEEVVEALNGERDWVEPEKKDDGTHRILRQNNIARKDPMTPIWSI